MLKPLFACLLFAAPGAAITAETPFAPRTAPEAPAPGAWQVSGSEDGCILYGNSRQGTVVSVLASPGQEALIFLIQNRGWSSLEDGKRHAVAVAFDDSSEYNFEAVARTELDADGPGLIFAVKPGESEGAGFISQFAASNGMQIGRDGQQIDSLAVEGGRSAMTSFVQCMGKMWSGVETDGAAAPALQATAGTAVEL